MSAKPARSFARSLGFAGILVLFAAPFVATRTAYFSGELLAAAGIAIILATAIKGEGAKVKLRSFSVGVSEVGLITLLLDALRLNVIPIGLESAFWITFAALTANSVLSMMTPRHEQ